LTASIVSLDGPDLRQTDRLSQGKARFINK
jgi:hypothetical protein